MDQEVKTALQRIMEKVVARAQQNSQALTIEYDPDWPSSCYLQTATAGDIVSWEPKWREHSENFQSFEKALELPLHPSITTYYRCFWSDNIQAVHPSGNIELIQVWNEYDFERLQQNLIGHILMKRRLRQPETLFFALTDEDDFILSVDNASGKVVLEQIGLEPQKIIANDLASFLSELSPLI